MKNNRSHILLLLLAAFFWGTTFVAQSIGADYVGAFTYLAGRSWIAVVFLTPIIRVMDKFADKRGIDNRRPKNAADRKQLALAGILCGASLCIASAAQQTGMKMIQLLPIYDTTQNRTWMDSYPYNAISVYALHPIYLDIRQLAKVNDNDFMHEYEKQRERLNGEFTVDYEQVTKLKRNFLQRLYRQEGPEVLQSPGYKRFFSENATWLMPYAAF